MIRNTVLAALLAMLFAAFAKADDGFEKIVQPFLKKHCVECHDAKVQKGDFRLDTLKPDITAADSRTMWKAVMDRTRAGEMPPAKKPRPAKIEIDAMTNWVEGQLVTAEKFRQSKEGRVVLRRLNRIEYENTIRDLMGVPVEVADLLPEDALSHGFDTVGEALAISPVHLERYLVAARKALDAAIVMTAKPEPKTTKHKFFDVRTGSTETDKKLNTEALSKLRTLEDGTQVTFSQGTQGMATQVAANLKIVTPGYYKVTLQAAAFQTQSPVAMAFLHVPKGGYFGTDQRMLGLVDYTAGVPQEHMYRVWMNPGDQLRMFVHGLPATAYNPKVHGPTEQFKGPGFAVKEIEVEGPLYDAWPHRGQQLLFGDLIPKRTKGSPKPPKEIFEYVSTDPQTDAERLLIGFTTKLFRHPTTKEKVAPYVKLFESELNQGAKFEQALRTAALAVMCAPDLLFLLETPGKLDDFALASRLSYFLVRTAPDGELLQLAAAGTLSQPAVLRAETERLLNLPGSKRFHVDFTDGWLDLRNIKTTDPDKFYYPEFDKLLEYSVLQETRLFFGEVLNNNHPAMAFVDSKFAMLNERLATHYGISGVAGSGFRKVPLKPEYHRGGVLTHASVLKVSANGSNTSPVVRGVYVLDRFLDQTPLPPPPGIPAVEPDVRGARTIREILAKHRSNETCASCHNAIDPPGFALESFDVIGGWREKFRVKPDKGPKKYALGQAVDASGVWPDGTTFAGFDEFRRQLSTEPDRFVRCLTKKLIAFGTGHEVGVADRAAVAEILAASAKKQHGFRDLIHAVVQSDLFRRK
jgi:mono/diheme cytochrome c family protein